MTGKRREEFIKEVAAAEPLEADFMVGLTSEQVAARKKEGFGNKVQKKVTKTYGEILVDNLFSFFNLVFFAIAIFMIVAKLEIRYYFFLLPIGCNIVIGLYSDIRARRLVDKLRVVTDPRVRAMREGKLVNLPVDEVVLSDIVVLEAGDQICVDGLLVHGEISTDESLVTGESIVVSKTIGSQVLSGSYVKYGKAYVRVNRVGIANYAEGLQDAAKRFKRPKSELKLSFLRIFWTTGSLAIAIGIAEIVTWLLNHPAVMPLTYVGFQRFAQGLSGSLVAMIPAGLYLLTSLTLAIGLINLAQKHMNVQDLYSIEMLARVDTVCFDKTGTLTDGKLAVKDFYNYSAFTDAELKARILGIIKSTGDNNGTARSLKESFSEEPLNASLSIPFDSARKYSAASFPNAGTFILGAPDYVHGSMSDIARDRIAHLAGRGYRVLGLFYSQKSIEKGHIPSKSELVAILSLSDHIKPDAKDNIEWFKKNGVAVKIISGDNPMTVSEIANEVGVEGAANFLSMENVKDEEIPSLVNQYTVFGRVSPEQKAKIIEALQNEGRKVAMTGDGVNDIIALKTADCSIAMASGSSAARNVANIVSVDNDFSKLPAVVGEGRRVINNLQRTAALFLAKTIFAIVLSFFFLVSSWFHGQSYPFFTNNMYVWEIVTIGGGGFFLALQPTNDRLKGHFLTNVLSRAIPAGIADIFAVSIIFAISLINRSFMSYETAKYLSVIVFSLMSYLVLFRISLPRDLYRSAVFGGLLAIGAGFFGLDIYVYRAGLIKDKSGSPIGFLGIDYNSIGAWHWLIGLIVLVVASGIYFLLDFLGTKILEEHEKGKVANAA
jgi:cation-transporting ATPase E